MTPVVGAAAVVGMLWLVVRFLRVPVRYLPGDSGSWFERLLRQAPHLAAGIVLVGGSIGMYLAYLVIESANS